MLFRSLHHHHCALQPTCRGALHAIPPARRRENRHWGRGPRYSQQRLPHQGMARAAGRQGQPDRGPGGPAVRPRLPHRWMETGGRPRAAPLTTAPPGGRLARHRGRSLLSSLRGARPSITHTLGPSSKPRTLKTNSSTHTEIPPDLPGQRRPNLTAAAFLNCPSLLSILYAFQ